MVNEQLRLLNELAEELTTRIKVRDREKIIDKLLEDGKKSSKKT